MLRKMMKTRSKEHQYNKCMNTADKLNALMDRVYKLEDLFKTAKAEDDRWTANMCLLEIDEINATLDKLDKEL